MIYITIKNGTKERSELVYSTKEAVRLVLQDLLGRNTDGQDIIEEAVRC